MNIHGYTLEGELANNNSGFSKWAFAIKKGKKYFLKEYMQPVYPVDEESMSETQLSNRRTECAEYEKDRRALYNAINRAGRGGLVKIEEFFRAGSKYYIAMERVCDTIDEDELRGLSREDRLLVCLTAAYSVKCLHGEGIVHCDLKPSNILVKRTRTGNFTAAIIDFDASFFEGTMMGTDDEVNGDLTYLAPESFMRMYGEDSCITRSADIFSLGLVFHEILCGTLPEINTDEYEYPFESVLDSAEPKLDGSLPEHIGSLIARMLSADACQRPDIDEVFDVLGTIVTKRVEEPEPTGQQSRPKDGFFSRAGDL